MKNARVKKLKNDDALHHFVRAYVGLGSNLNNPLQQVKQAVKAIAKHPGISLIAQSKYYQTKPWGYENQPDFINAVIAVDVALSAEQLLDVLQSIETDQGRVRTMHCGPRIIDLDILLYGDEVIHTKRLRVPHPHMTKRDFVLVPLTEIAPDLDVLAGIQIDQKNWQFCSNVIKLM